MPIKPIEAHKVKRKGELCWRVIIPRIVSSTGKRREKFFPLDAESKAKAFASEAERNKAAAFSGFTSLEVRHQAFVMDCIERLGGVAGGGLSNLRKATELFIAHNPSEEVTVQAMCDSCVERKEQANCAAPYLRALKATFRRFCKRYGAMMAYEISSRHIENWLDESGWGPETKRGELKNIRTLFSLGIKKGFVLKNPSLAVEMPEPENKPPTVLTVDQCAALLKRTLATEPQFIPYIALCLFGGLRPTEAETASWEDIKGDYIEVSAKRSKTRKRRLVTLNPTLRAWLNLGGTLPLPSNITKRRIMRRIKDGEGIYWPQDSLRHSFVSYSLPIHGIKQTAMEAGHSEQVLFAHYREVVTREGSVKFWRLTPAIIKAEDEAKESHWWEGDKNDYNPKNFVESF